MTSVYLGRYQIGTEIPVVLRCTLAGSPDTPLSHPTVEIRKDGSAVSTHFGKIPGDEQNVLDGFFRGPVMLDRRFETGRHALYYRWTDSAGNSRIAIEELDIVQGGDQDGAIIAIQHIDRPHARYLLWQTDDGKLVKGKNPR